MRILAFALLFSLCGFSTLAMAQSSDTLAPAPSSIDGQLAPDLGTGKIDGGAFDPSSIPPEEIPDIILQEMAEIENNCNANYFYSSFNDCQCIAVRFVDARLKSDPKTSKDAVMRSVADQCPSEEKIAGFIYESCIGFMKFTRPDDYAAFCKCAANDVALTYGKTPISNMRYIETIRKDAYVNCGVGSTSLPGSKSPYNE